MAYDISFHPIAEDEIKLWYFDQLVNLENGRKDKIEKLARKEEIEDFYIEKYIDTLEIALNIGSDQVFDKTHGFFIAIVQGFFRNYDYLRGKAFSFLLDEDLRFKEYTKSWEEILGQEIPNKTYNRIFENYSSGVYIPFDKVDKLLYDYENNKEISAYLNQHFNMGQIDIFLNILKEASSRKMGILEATEILQPNVLNLENTPCYSNLFNCNRDGIELFYKDSIQVFNDINL